MNLQPRVLGVVVSDMAASLAFYRRLGLPVPDDADAEPHVEIDLGSGLRLALDTEDTIRSFDPGWTRPTGGAATSLAFGCESPAGVDAAYADLVASGAAGHLPPWDAVWGMRYAVLPRSRRQRDRPVRHALSTRSPGALGGYDQPARCRSDTGARRRGGSP